MRRFCLLADESLWPSSSFAWRADILYCALSVSLYQPLFDDRSVLLLTAPRDEAVDGMCEVAVEVELHATEAAAADEDEASEAS